jgi:pimeloyl-ACP methyl ester carboxylesterase
MEPRIQYAQTSDGVSIAFWTLGEGMPLVDPFGLPFSHIQLEWQLPELRRWYEGLARNRKLIRYDHRGTGLSERTEIDYSLEAQLLDIEAVVSRLGLEEFALLGNGDAGPATITYAARHPKRVSHLVLFCSYAAGDLEARLSQKLRTAFSLMDTDWELFTETASHVALGWEEGEQARRFAALLRECTTPEALRTALGQISGFDVTSLLPHVKSPTLVLHRRQVPAPDVDVATGLASRIPDARLALLEGASPYAAVGDIEPVLQAIDEFLGEGEEAETGDERLSADIVHTILFTDVEGSTALIDRLGDAKARDLLREHEHIVREALKSHGGSEVKALGDGFMTSFSSATKALKFSIAIQRAFARHNESAEEPIGCASASTPVSR